MSWSSDISLLLEYGEISNKRQIDNLFVGWLIKANRYYIGIHLNFYSIDFIIQIQSKCRFAIQTWLKTYRLYYDLVLNGVLKLTTIYDDRTDWLIVLVHVHEFNGRKLEGTWLLYTISQLVEYLICLQKGFMAQAIFVLIKMCMCVCPFM